MRPRPERPRSGGTLHDPADANETICVLLLVAKGGCARRKRTWHASTDALYHELYLQFLCRISYRVNYHLNFSTSPSSNFGSTSAKSSSMFDQTKVVSDWLANPAFPTLKQLCSLPSRNEASFLVSMCPFPSAAIDVCTSMYQP